MAGPLNAKVILSRCSKTNKCFGIRVEQRGRDWVQTWAFPIDERKAKREGYGDTGTVTLSGEGDNYPGCPHCGSESIAQCVCKKTGCDYSAHFNGDIGNYTCPWCGNTISVIHGSPEVSGGGY
jgi:predicted RNA-binding Zn-ribbon protein involved in translation (DUF1610 family)